MPHPRNEPRPDEPYALFLLREYIVPSVVFLYMLHYMLLKVVWPFLSGYFRVIRPLKATEEDKAEIAAQQNRNRRQKKSD